MGWFTKKKKLVETPMQERKCECGFPYPLIPRYANGFTYKIIIKKHIKKCEKCDRVFSYYG